MRGMTLRMFQFTHPCGCDGLPGDEPVGNQGFNSRTRVGATFLDVQQHAAKKVSIHAPVWVRLTKKQKLDDVVKFQFTHPCGCDGLTNTV